MDPNPPRPRTPTDERGSVLVIVLFLTLGMGAMALAHLTKVVSEERKIQGEANARRAQSLAEGELQIAQNVVNAAPYVGGKNTALVAAITASPPVIPGTNVEVVQVPGSAGWYSLVARSEFKASRSTAQVMVRDRKPATSYNYFVVDHPLGVSGKPKGLIHSNKTVDFYFPDGEYRDRVSAVEGFNWRAGADTSNTTFLSGANGSAQYVDPLAGAQVTDAIPKADTLLVTDNYEAEIDLQGADVEVALFAPGHMVDVPVTRTRSVVDYYDTVTGTRQVPVYVTQTVQQSQPVYTTQTTQVLVQVPIYELQDVQVAVNRQVWVEDDPPPPSSLGGGAVATGSLGHWETVTEYETQQHNVIVGYTSEMQDRTTQVQTGTVMVDVDIQVIDSYVEEPFTTQVPVYRSEEYEDVDQVWVPRQYVRTDVVPADGTIYIEGNITKLGGTVEGQLSLVSNGSVKITESVQYVDTSGRTAMSGGLDPSVTYEANPDYEGDAVFSIASRGDILYSKDVPDNFELNAALTSTQGKVAFEGLEVSADGTEVTGSFSSGDPDYIKESLRRLGGIMSRKRPVSTWIGAGGGVLAGFTQGQTLMDPRLLLQNGGTVTPPFTFELEEPMWGVRSSGRLLGVPE